MPWFAGTVILLWSANLIVPIPLVDSVEPQLGMVSSSLIVGQEKKRSPTSVDQLRFKNGNIGTKFYPSRNEAHTAHSYTTQSRSYIITGSSYNSAYQIYVIS
jgi:hypothetical protein